MFTVLHQKRDGSEHLFSAIQIHHVPFSEKAGDTVGIHLLAGPGEAAPGVIVGTIRDGNVFVMNDTGATVGRFYLDRPVSQPNQTTTE